MSIIPPRNKAAASIPGGFKISDVVWSQGVDENSYGGGRNLYLDALLEQYKVYIEMADRVSARRATMNAFFLSLNTAIATGVAFVWGLKRESAWLLVFPLLVLLTLSGTWFFLITSYRQLNSAKFMVIAELETRLPASPYVRAEWAVLGEGKDKSLYWPLSKLEQAVPVVFATLYVVAFVVVAATRH
ncbi:hypothetical protein ABIA31_004766 [Catenulispora sp. MAP5-51]|uniref:RipA family octameric membrane protein n=1 Tax=Catenulispora sp. MAP5-51 TaxID=3156298 RepID=UPI003518E8A5